MTDAEMHAIQVEHTPMRLQRALAPRFKLLGEALVEVTDGAGTGSHSQRGLSHFRHIVVARPSHEHLRQTVGDLRFIATVAFNGMLVELAFTVSGHVDLL